MLQEILKDLTELARKSATFLLASMVSFISLCQEIEVRGGFIEDSVGIGEEIQFWLAADYPPSMQLIFPDSNYSFAPYELTVKEFESTKLVNGLAYDSAIYKLQSFEIDPIQYLKLDAIVVTEEDSIRLSSNTDSIFFKELAPVVTDTTRLKTNLDFQAVNRQFNFPLLWIVLGAFGIVALILFIAFGNRIRKHFKIKKMKRDYTLFVSSLSNHINSLKSDPEPETAEAALIDWKKYLEKLESIPYTKLTSKEILANNQNSELKNTLRDIDKTVYGKANIPEIYKNFQEIEDFTQHRYSLALEEVKNG